MPRARRRGNASLVSSLLSHAKQVMTVLGMGHRERVYHRAMITSLNRMRVHHRSEVISPIYFMGEVVGFGRCDVIIGNLVVEFKANAKCPKKTSPQLKKYMESLTKTEKRRFRGIVVNFNQRTGRVEAHLEHKLA
jgi:GxxExxY protein